MSVFAATVYMGSPWSDGGLGQSTVPRASGYPGRGRWPRGLTHYEAEAPPSRSAGLPMLNRKHKRVGWGGSRQHLDDVRRFLDLPESNLYARGVDNRLYEIDPDTGEVTRTFDSGIFPIDCKQVSVDGWINKVIEFDERIVLRTGGSEEHMLYGFDTDGNELWKSEGRRRMLYEDGDNLLKNDNEALEPPSSIVSIQKLESDSRRSKQNLTAGGGPT